MAEKKPDGWRSSNAIPDWSSPGAGNLPPLPELKTAKKNSWWISPWDLTGTYAKSLPEARCAKLLKS
jgi:hypothetical protein